MRLTQSILLLACVSGLTGCRLLDMNLAGTKPRLNESALSALRSRLKKDAWKANTDYDLLKLTAPPLRRGDAIELPPRWRFEDPLLQPLLDGLDRHARRTGDAGTSDYLEELAAGDELVAWNAAILLGQRDEQTGEPANNLQRLILDELTYDPESGRLLEVKPRRAFQRNNKNKPAVPSRDVLKKSSLRDLIEMSDDRRPVAKSKWTNLLERLPSNPLTQSAPGKPRQVSREMQNAAAEAYGRAIANARFASPMLLKELVHLTRRVSLPLSVREELMREAARRVSPASIPLIRNSILPRERANRHNRTSRMAAMEACLIHAIENPAADSPSIWPTRLKLAEDDPYPEIQALYGRWAALSRSSSAMATLKAQLEIPDQLILSEALHSYALLKTDDAKRELIAHANHKHVETRIAAARGLAQWHASDLTRFLNDASPQVRRAVADAMARRPNRGSGRLLFMLLKDGDRGVQMRCLESADKWEDKLAIPVFLRALSASNLISAENAWERLKKRTGIRRTFPALSTAKNREDFALRIARDHRLRDGRNWPPISGRAFIDTVRQKQLQREFTAVLTTLSGRNDGSTSYRLAEQRLLNMNPYERPEFDKVLPSFRNQLPPRIHEQVLKQIDPNYLYVYRLRHRDPLVRQRAAAQIAKLADPKKGGFLSPYVRAEMIRQIIGHRDRNVWHSALQALMHDDSPEGRKLAIHASQVPAPGLQVLACRYFRRYPHATYGESILSLMHRDNTLGVRLAAVEAAGFCSHPIVIEGGPPIKKPKKRVANREDNRKRGLLNLVSDSEQQIATEAIFSLVRLGHQAGFRRIAGLMHDRKVQVRMQAYEAIGDSGRFELARDLQNRRLEERTDKARAVIDAALKKLARQKPRRVASSDASRYHQDVQHAHSRRDHPVQNSPQTGRRR